MSRASSVSDVPAAELIRSYGAGSRLASGSYVFITSGKKSSGYKDTGLRVVAATPSPSSKKESSQSIF